MWAVELSPNWRILAERGIKIHRRFVNFSRFRGKQGKSDTCLPNSDTILAPPISRPDSRVIGFWHWEGLKAKS